MPSLALARLEAGTAVGVGLRASSTSVASIDFCSKLTEVSRRIDSRLSNAGKNLTDKHSNRKNNAKEREEKRAKSLIELRVKQDAERSAIYAKLEARATTTAQSQAVAEFKSSVNAAIATRRAAVDSAISVYWKGVSDVLNNRQPAVLDARQTYNTAMVAALTTAKNECSGGTAPATVRAHFSASVKAAVTQFNTNRKAIDKAGPQIEALAKTRNAAVKSATSAFRATLEQARITLKVSLGA